MKESDKEFLTLTSIIAIFFIVGSTLMAIAYPGGWDVWRVTLFSVTPSVLVGFVITTLANS